jgi:hypothetical protein
MVIKLTVENDTSHLNHISERIIEGENIVAVVGAGISTSCGIPVNLNSWSGTTSIKQNPSSRIFGLPAVYIRLLESNFLTPKL